MDSIWPDLSMFSSNILKDRTLTFIDMFSGIGTIRMGFEQVGHECVASIEFDIFKREMYEIIFGKEPEFGDITEVKASELPHANVWTFGAPCQDFSIAGKRDGLQGGRSSLVGEVFRLLREIKKEYKPELLLYENVKGMLSSNKGFDYLEILYQMDELGYDAEWQVINSKNYVPQNRERVYTIGHLRGERTRKIFPFERESEKVNCQQSNNKIKQIGNFVSMKRKNPQAGRVYDSSGISPSLVTPGGGNLMPNVLLNRACLTPNRINKRQNGRRFKDHDEPMFTLTTQDIHGVMSGKNIRQLTPRECWRLQGIDETIINKVIEAGISDSQMYKAAGDACTVPVIYDIASRLEVL